jgi:hypothetical protein
MAEHLFLDDRFRESSAFKGRGVPVEWKPPYRERGSHGNYLRGRLKAAWKEAVTQRAKVSSLAVPQPLGVYLSFKLVGKSDKQVAKLERMPQDIRKHGVRLRNVHHYSRGSQAYLVATGDVSWKNRYRYQSHGLRFKMIKPGEPEHDFIGRVNAAMQDDDNDGDESLGRKQSDQRWLIGSQTCSRGSVHSDIWQDATAAEVAGCNLIAVHPVIGWWRERKHLGKVEKATRYSLIETIETPAEDIDIYTIVESKVAVTIPVS